MILFGGGIGSDHISPGSVRLRMADSSTVRVHRHAAGALGTGKLPVLRVGRVNLDHGRRPVDIDGNVTFSALDLLAGKAAGKAAVLRPLYRLAVDRSRVGSWQSPSNSRASRGVSRMVLNTPGSRQAKCQFWTFENGQHGRIAATRISFPT